jgi:tetratricopeptide (TPR) repeat protein
VLKDLAGQPSLPASGKGLINTLDACRSITCAGLPSAARGPASESPSHGPRVADHGPRAADGWKKLEELTYVQAVLWIGARLADGLAHAHQRGILHRDLKPANVLLTDDGQPMLLDFNLSEDTKGRSSVSTAQIGGTLPYMAPEHLNAFQGGLQPVDARSDLYSLGVILYELLTGRHPFALHQGPVKDVLASMLTDRRQPAPDVRRWNKAVSPAVASILRRCLEPDPARRYPSAPALREDLQRHLDDQPLKHAPEPLRERARKWLRRHPRLTSSTTVALVAACLLLVLGSLALLRFRQQQDRQRGLERMGAVDTRNWLRGQMAAIRYQLSSPLVEPPLRREADDLARQALERFGVLDAPSWQDAAAFRSLPAEDQVVVREDLHELLLLRTRYASQEASAQADPARKREQLDVAFRHLATAEAFYPSDVQPRALWLQRSRLARLDGREADAQALWEQATQTPLRSIRDAYFWMTEAYLFRGQFRPALPLLNGLKQQESRNSTYWLLLADCYARLGQAAEAIYCYNQALFLEPEAFWAYFNRGALQLQRGKYQEAADDYDQVLRLRPGLLEANIKRAQARMGLKKYEEAIADLTYALDNGAPYTLLYFLRANAYEKVGKPAEARRDREEWLRREPSDEQSWVNRGVGRLSRGDVKGALADFDQALKLNPESLAALQNKAHVLAERLGETEAAVAVLDRAVTRHPDQVLPRAGRGVLLARLGRRDTAHQDAKEALALDQKPATLYQVACVYALTARQHEDDRGRALELLASALRQEDHWLRVFQADRDFDPIREHPDCRRLVEAARALHPSNPSTAPKH